MTSLARMWRSNERYTDAYEVLQKIKDTPYPYADSLFIERWSYQGMVSYELGMTCWWLPGKKQEGYDAWAKLLLMEKVPDGIREYIEKHLPTYM